MALDPTTVFADLTYALRADADNDVTSVGERLFVRGRLFAFRSGGLLVVDLSPARAQDLVRRGTAAPATGPSPTKGIWVSVADTEDWAELADEAHQFVGEPTVGGQS
jgi:hypothetical protein